MWLFKLLMMLFDLLFAFFAFSMSVRLFHHLGYSINVPLSLGLAQAQSAQVVAQMNRAGIFYRIGTRAYFYIVPLLFWLFGPVVVGWIDGGVDLLSVPPGPGTSQHPGFAGVGLAAPRRLSGRHQVRDNGLP